MTSSLFLNGQTTDSKYTSACYYRFYRRICLKEFKLLGLFEGKIFKKNNVEAYHRAIDSINDYKE